MDRLLGPGGCPWDQEQTHESLKKHLLEETYEVLEAIDSGNSELLKKELGDLLLQPVMHAQMEARDGNWSIDEVCEGIADKLVYRHPHVFGEVKVEDTAEVLSNWDKLKKKEEGGRKSVLEGIPRSMPALSRANQISIRAARSGFEWPNLDGVWEKLEEETAELKDAIASKDQDAIEAELGDMLFTVVNLSRWLRADPEDALRRMLDRFSARFSAMEEACEGELSDLNPEQWEELWQAAKKKLQS